MGSMRPWLAVAALGVALLALPALAQRRGGGSGGFAVRGGFGGHIPVFAGRPGTGPHNFQAGPVRPGIRGENNSGWWIHSSFGYRRGFYPYGFQRHLGRRWWYSWYPWWGWYGDLGWNNDYADRQPVYPTDANRFQDDSGYATSSAQQAEIDRLSAEVERLNNERAHPPTTSEGSRLLDESPATELVFRDKHTEQIQNYAIAGNVLYDLSGGHRRKIPLADLDLRATAKANEENGLDFQIPTGEGN